MLRWYFLLLLFFPPLLWGQSLSPSLIGSGGGTVMNADIQWTFSLGEPIMGLRQGVDPPEIYLLQGFQQPPSAFNPLPVEWLRFEVAAAGPFSNRLVWEVLQLGGESHFLIERSLDGQTFAGVGRLESRGAANYVHTYEWLDDDFPPMVLYYRIRQVDLDGQFSNSGIRLIDRRGADTPAEVLIYPNPTSGNLQWLLPAEIDPDELQLELYDPQGRLLRQYDLRALGNSPISLDGLPAGNYLYRIKLDAQVQHGRLLKF